MRHKGLFVLFVSFWWTTLHAAGNSSSKPVFRLFGSVGNETRWTPADDKSPLNPGNFLGVAPRLNLSDMALFGELYPESKSWKLHAKIRASGEWGRHSFSRVDLSELYINYSVSPWLDLQIGRVIEKWGTGYAWNPTGVVNPRKNPSDPNDRRSAYRGVDMVRADLFVHQWNVSLLAVPEIDWSGDEPGFVRSGGWAVRGYRLIRGVDLSLTSSGGGSLPNSQGVSAAKTLGDALEVHAEAAAFQDSLRYVPGSERFVLQKRRHAELLLGGQYTFPRNVNLVAEYLYNGEGLNRTAWSHFRNLAGRGQQELSRGNPWLLLEVNRHYQPLAMSRNYGFLRVYAPFARNRVETELIVLSSLRDGSCIVRPGIYWKIRPDWSLYWIQSEFTGERHAEFGQLQVKRASEFGLRYYF
ncbi:MAG TPA: hypothetical protein VGK99_21600 [Acidobacteriota bacterium]|jgi:hypothetical protein